MQHWEKPWRKEFNRQAARIYVERVLIELGLWKDNQEQKPLAALLDIQQILYAQALDLGFTSPLPSGLMLSPQLTLPLKWGKEEELIQFIAQEMAPEKLQKFYEEIDLSADYIELRGIVETFLDFASGWRWEQFDRTDQFPTYKVQTPPASPYGPNYLSRQLPIRVGEYAVSTQAQERFKAAKESWRGFLEKINNLTGLSLSDQSQQRVTNLINLGESLADEIEDMSRAEVTEWAEKIIRGEMAAVGRDMQRQVDVKTFDDFRYAINQLMDTAKLVLIYRTQARRFGWEVSTDKEELLEILLINFCSGCKPTTNFHAPKINGFDFHVTLEFFYPCPEDCGKKRDSIISFGLKVFNILPYP
ncbi:MAG: hypothetical protein N2691_03735 [Patescibacteria group bacterium]|nr:hypothetical protein [Patescibacteria group bacterium]